MNKNWAYGALALNNGNVGTIYYTAAYYELEGIVNPSDPERAYTPGEVAAIRDGAVNGAESYRFDAPGEALIGMTVCESAETTYWYDAVSAAAITRHPDPLTMDNATGEFRTAGGEPVAVPLKK